MNQRDALRFAAGELLDMAQCRIAEYTTGEAAIPDSWSGDDLSRVVKGFRTLVSRLEYTATGERVARPVPQDPDQYPLFEQEDS